MRTGRLLLQIYLGSVLAVFVAFGLSFVSVISQDVPATAPEEAQSIPQIPYI